MNSIYLWCITGLSAILCLHTLFRLATDRRVFLAEELTDYDRAFAWRIVFFLVFPFLNFLDLRSTMTACQLAGGYITNWAYGLVWFHVLPSHLPTVAQAMSVLFAGAAIQCLFALCLIATLAFRPHPFLATVLGYSAAFTFALNLLVDPLLSLAGLGGARWELAFSLAFDHLFLAVVSVYVVLAVSFIACLRSNRIRLWFSELTRPQECRQLKRTLTETKAQPGNARLVCRLAIAYDKAGLRRKAKGQLKKLAKDHPRSLYSTFLGALLAYRKRNYKKARSYFLQAADAPYVAGNLKAALLAASACSAFAENDTIAALNLSERALEFDDYCLVARLVKVDVFLAQGKKEEAATEILVAMRKGVDLELGKKIPLDADLVLEEIALLEEISTPSTRTYAGRN
jgi:tetratricopeptide (TPR) repeat protein